MGSNTTAFNKFFLGITFSLFVLWFLIFEFIVPENSFLPKPGIVFISVPALFENYNLLIHLFTTITAVYLPGILAYLFVFFIKDLIFRESGIIFLIIKFILSLTLNFPAVLTAILLVFWFPNSFFTEYLFSFLISALWIVFELKSNEKNKKKDYYVILRSMGANETFLNNNIVWNELKPDIMNDLPGYHLNLWSLILIFEYFNAASGLGATLRKILAFYDLSALFLMVIIITLLIFAGLLLLKFFENKYIFWESE